MRGEFVIEWAGTPICMGDGWWYRLVRGDPWPERREGWGWYMGTPLGERYCPVTPPIIGGLAATAVWWAVRSVW